MFHSEFYPTPNHLLDLLNLDVNDKVILDPSAGSGNILDYAFNHGAKKTLAIEITDELRQIVSDKHDLIGKDFFQVKEDEISHIDMIIMNPPFSNADKHILHAWEIASSGCNIVAICNNNTLENDYSRTRKQLLSIIKNYGNSQNLGQQFLDAERKTSVEIGYINLFKPKSKDDFNFDGFFIEEDEIEFQGEGIQKYDEVRALVNRYVGAVKSFDEMFNKLESLNYITKQLEMSSLELELSRNERILDRETFSKSLQKRSWQHIFNKMNLNKYVTSGVMKDINKFVEQQTKYPFTMKNIYKMFEIIIGTRQQTFERALEEAIDGITRHTHENRYNVEGWKTNSGYMLNMKFIQERVVSNDWAGFKIIWDSFSCKRIEDLTKVLCNLTAKDYNQIKDMYTAFQGIPLVPNKWYEYGFFDVKFFKKGTAHLKFKNENDWYLINQAYGKLKGFTLYSN
jgi:predicted RNA methylase